MRRVTYLVLAAAGLSGLAMLLVRVFARAGSPARETDRRLDRCRHLLHGIEDAVRDFRSAAASDA
ncbi:MAG: hypothetical protein QHJ73_03695 [Armatimonadota bacterium]|nr:hypothetical protein [Armatimonadota bacterium]